MKAKAVTIDYDASTNQVHVNPEVKVQTPIAKAVDGITAEPVVPAEPVEPIVAEPATPVEPTTAEPVVPAEPVDPVIVEPTVPAEPVQLEYTDERVIEYLSEKLGKELKTFDDLKAPEPEEQSEAVKKYLEFEKETGRGFEDFVKANRDFKSMSDDQLLTEFVLEENEGFDATDAVEHLDDLFGYEEDADEATKKRKGRLEKAYLSKAKKHFREQSEKYKVPLESRSADIPEEYVKALQYQKNHLETDVAQKEASKLVRGKFEQETEKVFSQDFKGFEINLGDDITETYKPSDVKATKEQNSNLEKFLGKFFDEKGSIKDAVGYHKALTVASDPEAFAKYFYEKGKNGAIAQVTSTSPQDIRNLHGTKITANPSGTVKSVDVNPRNVIPTGKLKLKNY